jgi:hypothetical protein
MLAIGVTVEVVNRDPATRLTSAVDEAALVVPHFHVKEPQRRSVPGAYR